MWTPLQGHIRRIHAQNVSVVPGKRPTRANTVTTACHTLPKKENMKILCKSKSGIHKRTSEPWQHNPSPTRQAVLSSMLSFPACHIRKVPTPPRALPRCV